MRIPADVRRFIVRALQEDLGAGDLTTDAIIPADEKCTAMLIAGGPFVVAGLPFAREVFRAHDRTVRFEPLVAEGTHVRKDALLARISGSTASLLKCERVALNILQRLSGVATMTARFVRKVEGTGARVLDTRKTTPCMRFMEKYAVRMGGGANHRMGLYDGILIKDNHLRAAGGVRRAVRLARKAGGELEVEVECESLGQVKEALSAGADIIMLDNMAAEDVRRAVRLARGRARLEASGGVTLSNIAELARTGVDYISVGALTHSAPAADISMEFE